MRIVLVAVAAALAALAGGLGAGAGQQTGGVAQYVVRPDPRMCPSPRCGGYWVALANRTSTPCGGGVVQARCYVASAVGRDGRALGTAIPDRALVRGSIEARSLDGSALRVLVVDALREPVGNAVSAPIYRVRDTGIRCVRAPCFFMRAWRLSTTKVVTVSELDLDPAGLTPGQEQAAQEALEPKNGGLFVAGRIVRASDGGRSLRASAVYLSP